MPDPQAITHAVVTESFRDAFSRRVGATKGKVRFDTLSDAIDVDVRTLKSWRDGQTIPQWHKLLRVIAFLGPEFADEILAPAGQGGVEWVTPKESSAEEIATALVAQANDLLQRLADGVFDHRDRAATARDLISLSRRLEEAGRAFTGESS